MNCREAIAEAKRLSKSENEPYTVWRCGDTFATLLENAGWPYSFRRMDRPIRPVATYDPDGTEHG